MDGKDEKGCSFAHLLMISTFIYVATALYSPFLSMHYTQHGLSSTQIGILGLFSCVSALLIQCVSALSEVPVLLFIRKLTKKYGAFRVIAFAGILSGVKLFLVSFGSLLLAVLVFVRIRKGKLTAD